MKRLGKYLFAAVSTGLIFLPQAMALANRPNADPNAPPAPGWVSFVPMIAMVAIFYMLLIRPQSKQRKERQRLIDGIKKGDHVLLQGGILATVVNILPQILEVKLNDDVRIKIQRSGVADILTEESYSAMVNGAQ